jgi:hypothetical protein
VPAVDVERQRHVPQLGRGVGPAGSARYPIIVRPSAGYSTVRVVAVVMRPDGSDRRSRPVGVHGWQNNASVQRKGADDDGEDGLDIPHAISCQLCGLAVLIYLADQDLATIATPSSCSVPDLNPANAVPSTPDEHQPNHQRRQEKR